MRQLLVNRRNFLLKIGAGAMSLSGLKMILDKESGPALPTLFVGHGSPMNVLEDNVFTRALQKVGLELPSPSAILCVSAHWQTRGTEVLSSSRPRQIFDFSGFPPELYKIQYTPEGAPQWAKETQTLNPAIKESEAWGLDHGTWTILHHMYPTQNIPVFQLSLNRHFNPLQHLELAQSLKPLSEKGILIIGSGNLVHNLYDIEWGANAPARSWASEFEAEALSLVTHPEFSTEEKVDRMFRSKLLDQAHPTVEHLIPLIYALGTSIEINKIELLSQGIQNASVSMASLKFY